MPDPGSNCKIMFAHSITDDIGPWGDDILDQGITISFRARISTTPPLDDLHPDGGSGIGPWPPGGYNNADLNCDGSVDFYDVYTFTQQWLTSCP